MMLPSRGLGSAVLVLALAMGPSTGCGDDSQVPADGGSSTSSGTGSTTTPAMTTVVSADSTAASMSESMGSTVGTSSTSSDPDTTQGVSATESSDGTTSGGTTDTGSTSSSVTASGGTTDMTGGTTDPTGGMMDVPDFSGDFLLAMATPLDPALPLQYIANFDYLPSGVGGGTVDVELQPLALDQGSTTTPRTFFGPPLAFPGIAVAPDGTFTIPVGNLDVAAETNPIVLVDAQASNVVIDAQVLDADDLCGTVDGMLVFPVASPLTGTTFAAVRVADVLPASLPVVFPVACP